MADEIKDKKSGILIGLYEKESNRQIGLWSEFNPETKARLELEKQKFKGKDGLFRQFYAKINGKTCRIRIFVNFQDGKSDDKEA